MDVESLRSGEDFSDKINQAIDQATCVVVLWSEASLLRSRWVRPEAFAAWQKAKLHSVKLAEAVSLPIPFNADHAPSLARWAAGEDDPELPRFIEGLRAAIDQARWAELV
jgi:hypothetical protein